MGGCTDIVNLLRGLDGVCSPSPHIGWSPRFGVTEVMRSDPLFRFLLLAATASGARACTIAHVPRSQVPFMLVCNITYTTRLSRGRKQHRLVMCLATSSKQINQHTGMETSTSIADRLCDIRVFLLRFPKDASGSLQITVVDMNNNYLSLRTQK